MRKQEKSKSRTTPNDQKEVKAGDYQDTKPIKSQKRVAMVRVINFQTFQSNEVPITTF